ncbi:MAG: Ku protein [Myxococcaceae bacterium]|nr:Ku protein [Myxococcaceae bacterium]
MSARAMAGGTISFGLVNIPVKVYSANESGNRISFNQLHAEKKTRLKQQMYDPATGEIVPKDQIIKGYEYAKDQYVIVDEEELEKLELATSRSMDITEFVPLETVDPLYFESGYYIGPDKGADRAFKLLVQALTDMKHAAVARYVTRGRQNLVLFRPLNHGLVMQQLRYSDEVRGQGEIPIPDAQITEAELGLARQFIQQLSQPKFDATKYRDEYREKLKALLDAKVNGQTINLTPQPEPVAKVVDLMEALKASLAGKASAPPPAAAATAAPAPELASEERKGPKRAARGEEPAKKKKSARG